MKGLHTHHVKEDLQLPMDLLSFSSCSSFGDAHGLILKSGVLPSAQDWRYSKRSGSSVSLP